MRGSALPASSRGRVARRDSKHCRVDIRLNKALRDPAESVLSWKVRGVSRRDPAGAYARNVRTRSGLFWEQLHQNPSFPLLATHHMPDVSG